METGMSLIAAMLALGIALAGVSPIRLAVAADQAPDTAPQPLVNREERVPSETDRQQLKRYFLQNWRNHPENVASRTTATFDSIPRPNQTMNSGASAIF
jgi:hypothetical protein